MAACPRTWAESPVILSIKRAYILSPSLWGLTPPPPVIVFIGCSHRGASGSWLLSSPSYITVSVNHPGMLQVRKIQTLKSPLKAPIPGLRSHCSLWYFLSLIPQVFSKGLLHTCSGTSCPGAEPTHEVPPDTANGVERSRVGAGRADGRWTGPPVPYLDDTLLHPRREPTSLSQLLVLLSCQRGLPWQSSGSDSVSHAGVWVPSFVRELSSHMLHGQKTKT